MFMPKMHIGNYCCGKQNFDETSLYVLPRVHKLERVSNCNGIAKRTV